MMLLLALLLELVSPTLAIQVTIPIFFFILIVNSIVMVMVIIIIGNFLAIFFLDPVDQILQIQILTMLSNELCRP